MNEGSYSQYCAICWSPVFWDAIEHRTIYTCACHTRQFKQPTISAHWTIGDDSLAFSDNKRTEVPQAFYDAFKEEGTT